MIAIALVLCCCISACEHKASQAAPEAVAEDTVQRHRQRDTVVVDSPKQAELFQAAVVQYKDVPATIRVTGKVVARAVKPAEPGMPPLLVFETNAAAQLYTEYLKAKAAYQKSATQLARIRDMAAHQAASGRELLEAETEHRLQEATLLDAESELRQSGLHPHLLAQLQYGSVLIACDVPESQIGFVKVGRPVQITFAALPQQELTAYVVDIASAVDPVSRIIKVFVMLSKAPEVVRPGMFVTAKIYQQVVPAALVPQDAVVVAEGKSYVFVKLDSTTIVRRQVVTMGTEDGYVRIIDGLRPGEKVVVTNAILLKGMSLGY